MGEELEQAPVGEIARAGVPAWRSESMICGDERGPEVQATACASGAIAADRGDRTAEPLGVACGRALEVSSSAVARRGKRGN